MVEAETGPRGQDRKGAGAISDGGLDAEELMHLKRGQWHKFKEGRKEKSRSKGRKIHDINICTNLL